MIGFRNVSMDGHGHQICAEVTITCKSNGVLFTRGVVFCENRPIGVVSADGIDTYQGILALFVHQFCQVFPCHICEALHTEDWSWRTNGYNV